MNATSVDAMRLHMADTSENDNVLDVPYTALGWSRNAWPRHFSIIGHEGTFNYFRTQYADDNKRVLYWEYRDSMGRVVRVRG